MNLGVFVFIIVVIFLYFDKKFVRKLYKSKLEYIYKLNFLYLILIILLFMTSKNLTVYDLLFIVQLLIVSNYDIVYSEIEDLTFLKFILSIIIYSFMQTKTIDIMSLYNGIFMFIPLTILYFRNENKFGGGDVKVLTVISAFKGIKLGVYTLFFASLTCITYYLLNLSLINYRIKKFKFIPFLTLGLIISLYI